MLISVRGEEVRCLNILSVYSFLKSKKGKDAN